MLRRPSYLVALAALAIGILHAPEVHAGGLSVLVKLVAKAITRGANTLADAIADPSAGRVSQRVTEEALESAGIAQRDLDQQEQDLLFRFRQALGDDYPHLDHLNVLLATSPEELTHADRVALYKIFADAAVARRQTPIGPLCGDDCVGSPHQLSIANRAGADSELELQPEEFATVYRRALRNDLAKCNTTGKICVSDSELSFQVGCKDGASITVSTSALPTISIKQGNTTIDLPL